jgi:hypothetical protein
MEIGPKDTTFEVFIDGRRQGSLHISKGGIDWSPKMSKVKRYAKTWSQLRDFMEGDGEKAVEKEPSESSSDDEDDEVIDSLDSLLRILGCDSLHEAEDRLREHADTETDISLFKEEGGVLRICTGGYGEVLTYPFHMGELWSVVKAWMCEHLDRDHFFVSGQPGLEREVERYLRGLLGPVFEG